MTLIRSEYLMGIGKDIYTHKDIDYIEKQIAETFNMTIKDVKESVGLEIEDETHGIKRTQHILRPSKRFFVNENEFIAWATVSEQGHSFVTVEDKNTGNYSSLYDPSEWK